MQANGDAGFMEMQCENRCSTSTRRIKCKVYSFTKEYLHIARSAFHDGYHVGMAGEAEPPSGLRGGKPLSLQLNKDEVSLCYDYTRLILKRRRRALDQVEQTVAARLNVRTVLDVVRRPETLRCYIISLIE
jgi:hypothetical protein